MTLCTDSFNRADSALGGSTLDNANGGSESDTWTSIAGTWSVGPTFPNVARETAGTNPATIIVNSTTAVDVQRVSITLGGSAGNVGVQGPLARYNAGDYYLFYISADGAQGQLFKRVGGSFTQLGASGGVLHAGDVMSVDCSGTSISTYINGVLDIGPITDSAIATGRPGMFDLGNNTALFDNFKYEVTAVAGGFTPLLSDQWSRIVIP